MRLPPTRTRGFRVKVARTETRGSASIGVVLLLMCLAASAPSQETNACRLALPKLLDGVVGREMNLYFDNLILAPPGRVHLFSVRGDKGRLQEERWTFVPKEAGEFSLAVLVRNLDDQVIGQRAVKVRVAPETPGEGRQIRLLAIGDSLTQGAVYTDELMKLFGRPGHPPFALMGTHHVKGTAEGNVHEGYGGWKYRDFVEKWETQPDPNSERRQRSPFLFESAAGPVLDIGRYFRESHGGVLPTHVTIFLGANDMFSATDATLGSVVEGVCQSARKLVEDIRRAAPRAVVGILPPLPPSASQDAFGENYGCAQTRWQYRKNQHRLVEELLAAYGNCENEGIFIVPSWVGFDCARGYPTVQSPASSRSSQTVARACNAVHPTREGYLQLAEVIYAWLRNHPSSETNFTK